MSNIKPINPLSQPRQYRFSSKTPSLPPPLPPNQGFARLPPYLPLPPPPLWTAIPFQQDLVPQDIFIPNRFTFPHLSSLSLPDLLNMCRRTNNLQWICNNYKFWEFKYEHDFGEPFPENVSDTLMTYINRKQLQLKEDFHKQIQKLLESVVEPYEKPKVKRAMKHIDDFINLKVLIDRDETLKAWLADFLLSSNITKINGVNVPSLTRKTSSSEYALDSIREFEVLLFKISRIFSQFEDEFKFVAAYEPSDVFYDKYFEFLHGQNSTYDQELEDQLRWEEEELARRDEELRLQMEEEERFRQLEEERLRRKEEQMRWEQSRRDYEEQKRSRRQQWEQPKPRSQQKPPVQPRSQPRPTPPPKPQQKQPQQPKFKPRPQPFAPPPKF